MQFDKICIWHLLKVKKGRGNNPTYNKRGKIQMSCLMACNKLNWFAISSNSWSVEEWVCSNLSLKLMRGNFTICYFPWGIQFLKFLVYGPGQNLFNVWFAIAVFVDLYSNHSKYLKKKIRHVYLKHDWLIGNHSQIGANGTCADSYYRCQGHEVVRNLWRTESKLNKRNI